MIVENCLGKLISILAQLKETKFANGRQLFKLDSYLIETVSSLICYEYSADGVFQWKHLLRHPKCGIKTFVYDIDVLNFLLETVEKKFNE
mgnify:CR=1 FL=1